MQKIKVLFTLLFGLMLSSICLANTAQENFTKATKYIEPNGECYVYSNLIGVETFVNKYVPAAVRILTQNDPQTSAIAVPAVNAVKNLLNVSAFKAVAYSSVEAEKGIYIDKSFILFDREAKSIFIDPKPVNAPLNLMALPADTRIAMKFNLNLAHAWALIKKEIAATPWNAQLAQFTQNPDLNLVLNNFHGDIELLVTGTSLETLAFKAVITDKGNHIAATVRKFVGDMVKNNTIEIPLPENFKITVKLTPGKIIAVSSPKLMLPPKKTIASKPLYQKYAKYLPKNGTGYVVIDIPQEVIDLVKAQFKDSREALQLIDLLLKPVSVACVATAEKDGAYSIAAANISFAQIAQVYQSGGSFVPVTLGMMLPALHSARDRARTVSCVSNLKQLGTAILMYAMDNDDFLPADLKAIVKGAYLEPKVLENLVYVGPYEKTKISQIKKPSQYVIVVCKLNAHHNTKTLNILFIDGHVESHKITQDPIEFMRERFNLSEKDVERITKRLAE